MINRIIKIVSIYICNSIIYQNHILYILYTSFHNYIHKSNNFRNKSDKDWLYYKGYMYLMNLVQYGNNNLRNSFLKTEMNVKYFHFIHFLNLWDLIMVYISYYIIHVFLYLVVIIILINLVLIVIYL